MRALAAAALVGVLHVHHAPSHDSDAPFAGLIAAAHEVGLDFLVLTDHSDLSEDGPLPAAAHAGLHTAADGHRVLVLVGAEFGTGDGHLVGLAIPRAYASQDASGRALPGRELIERIHTDGGFAVVPHPFTHGGWHDWDAPFDALEVHNNASAYARQHGPLYPLRLLRYAFDTDGALRRMLSRPDEELERWDALLAAGRPVVGLSGADAHRNTSVLGVVLDPWQRLLTLVQTLCPDGPLEAAHLLGALRRGRCWIRWRIHQADADLARERTFPSGRSELVLDDGGRVLEVRNPPPGGPPRAPTRSRDAR